MITMVGGSIAAANQEQSYKEYKMNFDMLLPIIFFLLSFCFMVIAVCLIVKIVHSNKRIKQLDKKELIITEETKSVNTSEECDLFLDSNSLLN